MRQFIGIRPSPDFRAALCALQKSLQSAGVSGRWLEPSNLHLTLAFIGEWPEPLTCPLPAIERPFDLKLSHAGIFPEAKVLWAGVEPSDALEALADRVRRALKDAAVPFDGKPFVPHITLARKPAVPEGLSLQTITPPPAVMHVRQVCLYRSDHMESGMVYTVIGQTEAVG